MSTGKQWGRCGWAVLLAGAALSSFGCVPNYRVKLPSVAGGLASEPSTQAFFQRVPLGFPLAPMAGNLSPNLRGDQNPRCSIAVSMSGGGTNSASYALGALQRLNALYGPLPDGRSVLTEIDFLPTASGGGLSALLLIEVLREHQVRENSPLAAANVDLYFGKSRFRSALDFAYAESWSSLEFVWEVIKGNASRTLLNKMETAITGIGRDCRSAGQGGSYLAPRPLQSDQQLVESAMCQLGAPSWGELRSAAIVPQLPAFLPAVSLFESGHQIPATPDWLRDLGLTEIAFGLYGHPAHKIESPVSLLNPRQSVAMSMSFPGIGPVAGLARSPNQVERVVVLADGGQTDNLALWLGFHALLEEHARQKRGTRMVHIALDSALVLPLPDINSEGGLTDGLFRVAASAVPQLNLARRRDPWLARQLAEKDQHPYALFHVDAERVLAADETLDYLTVPDGAAGWVSFRGNTLRRDLDLIAKPEHRQARARERALFNSSLERRVDEVEVLMALGAAAMEKENSGGVLVDALRKCLESQSN